MYELPGEAVAESVGQAYHFRVLGVGGEQLPLEAGVCRVLGRLDNLAAHNRRPPELDGRLGKTLVGDNLLCQPLRAPVGVWRQLAVEAWSAHVAVPGVAMLVGVCHHRYLGEVVFPIPIPFVPIRPGHDLDVVDPDARDLDVNEERAFDDSRPRAGNGR